MYKMLFRLERNRPLNGNGKVFNFRRGSEMFFFQTDCFTKWSLFFTLFSICIFSIAIFSLQFVCLFLFHQKFDFLCFMNVFTPSEHVVIEFLFCSIFKLNTYITNRRSNQYNERQFDWMQYAIVWCENAESTLFIAFKWLLVMAIFTSSVCLVYGKSLFVD